LLNIGTARSVPRAMSQYGILARATAFSAGDQQRAASRGFPVGCTAWFPARPGPKLNAMETH
jgi:hypothetical protein